MVVDDEVFEELKTLIIKMSGADDEPITVDTSLENDLGITGDDAIDLLLAYRDQFKVDVRNFMAGDYFNAEGTMIFFMSRMKPFTVGHLYKGIIAGRLDEEVINS